MGLLGSCLLDLMWVHNVILVDNLWSALGESKVLSLEELSSLLSCGVHTEKKRSILIRMGERVKFLFFVLNMTLSSNPPWLWDFIVEES